MASKRPETANALTSHSECPAIDAMLLVTDLQRARGSRQLLEPRATHQGPLVLLLKDPLRLGQELAILTGRCGRLDVNVDRDRNVYVRGRPFRGNLVLDPAITSRSVKAQLPTPEGFDEFERQRPRAEGAGSSVEADGVTHRT